MCRCFRQPVVVYKLMKKLSTQLSMSLFLGVQPDQPEADKVSELMTTHWRGQHQIHYTFSSIIYDQCY